VRPRPCQCDRHVPGEPFLRGRDCARCWLWHNVPRYRGEFGWGDAVAWLARRLGLAWLARRYESATGRPCGCAARQAALNRLPRPRRLWRRLLGSE
jgi:hypothetical protein